MLAVMCNHGDVVALLLNHGADLTLKNKHGMTAMDLEGRSKTRLTISTRSMISMRLTRSTSSMSCTLLHCFLCSWYTCDVFIQWFKEWYGLLDTPTNFFIQLLHPPHIVCHLTIFSPSSLTNTSLLTMMLLYCMTMLLYYIVMYFTTMTIITSLTVVEPGTHWSQLAVYLAKHGNNHKEETPDSQQSGANLPGGGGMVNGDNAHHNKAWGFNIKQVQSNYSRMPSPCSCYSD